MSNTEAKSKPKSTPTSLQGRTSTDRQVTSKAKEKVGGLEDAPPTNESGTVVGPLGSSYSNHAAPQQISAQVIENWREIIYRIFEYCSENSKVDIVICSPQILSTIAFLMQVGEPEVMHGLIKGFMHGKKELPVTSPEAFRHTKDQITDATYEFLSKWQSEIQNSVRPDTFFYARRCIVHNQFCKSYTYHTYTGFDSFEVELKIAKEDDIVDWVKQVLKVTIPGNPFRLWSGLEPGESEMTAPRKPDDVVDTTNANQKCPILLWASSYNFSLPANIVENDTMYFDPTITAISDVTQKPLPILHMRFKTQPQNPMRFWPGDSSTEGVLDIPLVNKRLNIFIIFGPLSFLKEQIRCEHNERLLAYVPMWKQNEKAINIAKPIMNLFESNSVFSVGGFGDLGPADAEPSYQKGNRKTPNIQHFDGVNLMNPPDTKNTSKIPSSHKESAVVVTTPYILLIWDAQKAMPIYSCSINYPLLDGDVGGQRNEIEKAKRKRCTVM
ncbi:hypothetical protein WR25_18388 [Diploscapter pachys]|uniref:Serpin domain-containing protein n=1 Tax=Diploscapter pachys TaxID=2018661 RepID=A0A2A2JZS9_9BILA|nr:hypothetical protein WR25_18388 [Diploscapter pachys]